MGFTFEEDRASDSPFVEKIWRVQSDQVDKFVSVAATHSEIVIARYKGETTVTVRGPETKATTASTLADSDYFGIVFRLGTFMPGLLPKNLVDRRDADLPLASGRAFWLDSSAWEIPNFDNAETFVARLVRQGLLAYDPVVGSVLQGRPQPFSTRTLQYRFARATGLTYKVIQQIERAKRAAALLESGISILDTAHEMGYFDQAHLTNSLKRFIGQTPTQLAHPTHITE